MKEITVPVVKFECVDGRVCDTKEQAERHEAQLRGEVKLCPHCNGTRAVDPYGDGHTLITCGTCGGKGYVTKIEVWK